MFRTRKSFFTALAVVFAGWTFNATAEEIGYRITGGHWGGYSKDGTSAKGKSACGGCQKSNCDGKCATKSACAIWHVRLDGLFLDRSSSASAVLARQNVGANVLLTAGDLSFSADGGFRVSFLRDIDEGAWEISWLNGSWDAAASAAETGNVDSVLGTAGFAAADGVTATYFSELDSIELNQHWYRSHALSIMAGLRYVSLDEAFNMTSTAGSSYGIGTTNDLFGLQIGVGWHHCLWSDVSFNLLAKGGVYYANRSQDVDFRDTNGNALYRNEDNGVAFVGEVDANITWQVCQRFAIRGGFQYFWFQGMALAPEQFQSTLAAIQARPNPNSGSLNMYGGYLGGEFSW